MLVSCVLGPEQDDQQIKLISQLLQRKMISCLEWLVDSREIGHLYVNCLVVEWTMEQAQYCSVVYIVI